MLFACPHRSTNGSHAYSHPTKRHRHHRIAVSETSRELRFDLIQSSVSPEYLPLAKGQFSYLHAVAWVLKGTTQDELPRQCFCFEMRSNASIGGTIDGVFPMRPICNPSMEGNNPRSASGGSPDILRWNHTCRATDGLIASLSVVCGWGSATDFRSVHAL